MSKGRHNVADDDHAVNRPLPIGFLTQRAILTTRQIDAICQLSVNCPGSEGGWPGHGSPRRPRAWLTHCQFFCQTVRQNR